MKHICKTVFGCLSLRVYQTLYVLLFVWLSAFFGLNATTSRVKEISSKEASEQSDSAGALLNNLPKVALLVKEQYVDPLRINPEVMLASILDVLESRITKLVITLPKPLEKALELAKAAEFKQGGESDVITAKPPSPAAVKKSAPGRSPEKLVIDLGGVKKTFNYEEQRSIWGMIFLLRDIFKFVESEAIKQGLTEKTSLADEPLDWEKIESALINGMLSSLDPHSVYLEPKYARDLTLTTKGEFGGIGIVLSVRDGFLTVISPIAGTPAALVGIKAKDRIIKIDDDSAINMDLNDAVNMLRGKADSIVRITVQRQNISKDMEFSLKRAIIKIDSVAYALIDHIAYLHIKAFQGNTASDVKEAILDMKRKAKNKLSGLILDMRGNPGGLLREAVEVASLFIDKGEVVSTKGARAESRQVEMASGGQLDKELPIAVLVDGGSASASEIVSAAIKKGGEQGGRGVIIGEKTFGKGSVQMLFDFPSNLTTAENGIADAQAPVQPAALKLTIAEYFGPNNTNIQNVGVIPDIALTAVSVNKLEEIRLFPEASTREIDLEGHLATRVGVEAAAVEQPLAVIDYPLPPEAEEAAEYGKLDLSRLKKDFFVIVASEFIKRAQSSKRDDLLRNASSIENDLQRSQQKKINEALKRFGIDWSAGESKVDRISAVVSSNKGAKAGDKLKVSIKVKNTKEEPIFQVHGVTQSQTPLFDKKELIFGKLLPGQEREKTLEFDIPADVIARKDFMKVELRDGNRRKVAELAVPLEIIGLSRPRFSHMVYADDHDGSEAKGKEIGLTLWLKNIGEGKASEPTILLRNESGSKVFLKNGRFQASELSPEQQTSMKFDFRVKEPTEKIDFEIQIFDGKMHDLWRDKVSIDVKEKQRSIPIAKIVTIKDRSADLLDKPNEVARTIATIRRGLEMKAIREIGDYALITVDTDLQGFINKNLLTEVSPTKAANAPANKKDFYSIKYDRVPAEISLRFGDGSGWSRLSYGNLNAVIKGADRLSGILLYINGKKVLYKDVVKDKGVIELSHRIELKPGVNVISLFAREDAVFGQRENITIYYDADGLAMAALPKNIKEMGSTKSRSAGDQ